MSRLVVAGGSVRKSSLKWHDDKKDMEATRLIRGLEHLWYGDRLGELGLLREEKVAWRLQKTFQYLKGSGL